jgi:hypothetical protein
MPLGRGDSRNFSGGYGQIPPPDYSGKVGSDDLRRLGSKASARQSSGPSGPTSFGPGGLLGSRSNSGRKGLGPNLSRGGDDSGASSRTGTPLLQPQPLELVGAMVANVPDHDSVPGAKQPVSLRTGNLKERKLQANPPPEFWSELPPESDSTWATANEVPVNEIEAGVTWTDKPNPEREDFVTYLIGQPQPLGPICTEVAAKGVKDNVLGEDKAIAEREAETGKVDLGVVTLEGVEDVVESPLTPRDSGSASISHDESKAQVQQELDETKTVLNKTIESVLERGKRIDSLGDWSGDPSSSSKLFIKSVRKPSRWYTPTAISRSLPGWTLTTPKKDGDKAAVISDQPTPAQLAESIREKLLNQEIQAPRKKVTYAAFLREKDEGTPGSTGSEQQKILTPNLARVGLKPGGVKVPEALSRSVNTPDDSSVLGTPDAIVEDLLRRWTNVLG